MFQNNKIKKERGTWMQLGINKPYVYSISKPNDFSRNK